MLYPLQIQSNFKIIDMNQNNFLKTRLKKLQKMPCDRSQASMTYADNVDGLSPHRNGRYVLGKAHDDYSEGTVGSNRT